MEFVRREVRLGKAFTRDAFQRAFATFQETYNVRPLRALCAPDVLERFGELFERSSDAALRHAILQHDGVPLVAALLAPGIVAFEGEVDEERMGDW
jgi:chorismate-pyruvate lyase